MPRALAARASGSAEGAQRTTQDQEGENMAIGIKTSGVHHVALRSTDLRRARQFYIEMLGFQPILEAEAHVSG